MGKNFKALLQKQLAVILIAVIGSACSLGVIAAAAYVLIAKLAVGEASVGIAVAVGLCSACAVAAIALPLTLPTEKRAARRLDRSLSLGQRAETMLAFRGSSGMLIDMQREDAEDVLGKRCRDRLFPYRLWLLMILPVVAACLVISAALVPSKAPPSRDDDGGPAPEIWELTSWHVSALRALIEEVRASDMQQSGKDGIIQELELVIADLEPIKTVPGMKERVIDAMIVIDTVADELNSFSKTAGSLVSSADPKVKKYGEALGSLSDPIIESKYEELKASFTYEGISDELRSFSSGITRALSTSNVDAEDELYIALNELAEALSELSSSLDGETEDEARSALGAVFDSSAERLSVILSVQYVNRTVANDTNNELMYIFGITEDELPDELKYSDDTEAGAAGGDYEEREDEVITDGGKGSGEVVYGSDDAVLDPETDEHVSYGELLAGYDSLKSTELEERTLSDAIKEFIAKYFDKLYYDDEEKNN